jgi:hypothetical protein
LSLHHKEKINLLLSDIPIKSSGKGYGYGYGYGSSYGYGYGYGYGAGYGYGYGAGYGYGYGQKGKKHRYGVDYIRTKLSKKSADAPHQYIDDEEDA